MTQRVSDERQARRAAEANLAEYEAVVEAAFALNVIVEEIGCKRWTDEGGRRLKDTTEWAAFYVALAKLKERKDG